MPLFAGTMGQLMLRTSDGHEDVDGPPETRMILRSDAMMLSQN